MMLQVLQSHQKKKDLILKIQYLIYSKKMMNQKK